MLGACEVLERHIGGAVPGNVPRGGKEASRVETGVDVPEEVAALVEDVHISVAESTGLSLSALTCCSRWGPS